MTPAGEEVHRPASDARNLNEPKKQRRPSPMLNVNPDIATMIIQWLAINGTLVAFAAFAAPALVYIVAFFLLDPARWSEE